MLPNTRPVESAECIFHKKDSLIYPQHPHKQKQQGNASRKELIRLKGFVVIREKNGIFSGSPGWWQLPAAQLWLLQLEVFWIKKLNIFLFLSQRSYSWNQAATQANSPEECASSLLQPGRATLYKHSDPKPDPKPWLSCIWSIILLLLSWRRLVLFAIQQHKQPNSFCCNCRQPQTHLLLQHIPTAKARSQPLLVPILSLLIQETL